MGAVSRVMKAHGTNIRRGHVELHRDQATVERLNRILAKRLFGHQYAVEMRLPEGVQSVVWVTRLSRVVAALNNQTTRLTVLKPADAIREQSVLHSEQRRISDLLKWSKKSSLQENKCAICFNLVSWKVEHEGPQTLFGL